jgi:hypothetical protein
MSVTSLLDLIEDAEMLRRDVEKAQGEYSNEKTKIWLQMACSNAEQALACLMHAQKQEEEE